jgi:hypothetical protein
MDDSRITSVSEEEVLSAEAYMLFYRVVDHPYTNELSIQVKILNEMHAKQRDEAKRNKESKMDVSPARGTSNSSASVNQQTNKDSASSQAGTGPAASVKNNPRKRKAPEFTCGEDWARRRTRLPDDAIAGLRFIEAKVSEFVKFTSNFSAMLHEQARRPNAKVGHGPSSGICCTYM